MTPTELLQDERFAARQSFGGEMADRLAIEVIVLVELDDVPVLAGLAEELAPGRGWFLQRPEV
jgi:hypothetical protein